MRALVHHGLGMGRDLPECPDACTTIAASSPISTTSGAGSGLWNSPTMLSMVSSAETSWLLQSSLLSRLDCADLPAAIMLYCRAARSGALSENQFARARLAGRRCLSGGRGTIGSIARLERRGQAASWRHVMAPGAVAGTRGLPTCESVGILLSRSGRCRVTDGDNPAVTRRTIFAQYAKRLRR